MIFHPITSLQAISSMKVSFITNKETDIIAGVCIYPTPLLRAGYNTRSILKRGTTGKNSVFFLDLLPNLDSYQHPIFVGLNLYIHSVYK